ncbi:hypothetical protein VTK56DRAFT_10019 [Thermocarpiscus australiensis]
MATAIRQPFAPLNEARLKSLTSIKNIQNSIPNAPVKRKAEAVLDDSDDDAENIDPIVFSKRSKGADGGGDHAKSFTTPSFVLTKAPSAPSLHVAEDALNIPSNEPSSDRQRSILKPKSPASRLSIKSAASSPLRAPAGRSPTRGSKRMGILSRRRIQRVDPPSIGPGATVPFSLDDALKGTIPSYSGSLRGSSSNVDSCHPEMKSSWFFDIHEDTPEQEMTNLLQHSTCTLDISSDEESEGRARRDRAKGLDKENIPPADDVSQTSSRSARTAAADFDDMVVEKQRGPLAKMNVADLYEGGDSSGIIIVPGDEEETETVVDGGDPSTDAEAQAQCERREALASDTFKVEPAHPDLDCVDAAGVEDIMGSHDPAATVALLESIEGQDESFQIWESSSAKDECE